MSPSSHNGFVRSFGTISLQRKLLLFVVIALSVIFTASGILIYVLVNDTFIETEKRHIAIISEPLSAKIGVWYFINKDAAPLQMDEFLHSMLDDYSLEYIAFKDQDGTLVSEVAHPGYVPDDPYNLVHTKIVHSPGNGNHRPPMGTLVIANSHHVLKELSFKYYAVGVVLIVLLGVYFYLEMRLLKELLTPLHHIAAQIKNYLPGDNLTFGRVGENRSDDVISEIAHGFLQMQDNIDDAMRRKRIEEENNRAKDAFLLKQSRFIEMGTMINNIAHQWKQPLNIIELCITDLTFKSMFGTFDPEHQQKVFDDMHRQVAFMSETIDVFRNFLNGDNEEKHKEIFSLKKAIEESLQLLGSTLEKKKIATRFTLDEEARAFGSISEIEQVILTIINNAVDAGSTRIAIECSVQKSENLITVRDNGGGFDPAVIDKVFDAYFTTKHQSQGTGLGLFIARMIVEMKFHGTIEAVNAPEGAMLLIRLPLPESSSARE